MAISKSTLNLKIDEESCGSKLRVILDKKNETVKKTDAVLLKKLQDVSKKAGRKTNIKIESELMTPSDLIQILIEEEYDRLTKKTKKKAQPVPITSSNLSKPDTIPASLPPERPVISATMNEDKE